LQRLLDLMNGEAYQSYVKDLVGYDCRLMGQVQTLEQAFGKDIPRALH